MAERGGDNFEWCATADLSKKYNLIQNGSGTFTVTTAAKRNGANGVRHTIGGNTNFAQLQYVFDNQPTWVIGHSINVSRQPGTFATLCAFLDTSSIQMDIRLTSAGTISATRNGTTLGTSTAAILAGVTYYLETKVTISNTVGTVDIHLNGVSILSLSGLDTQNTANASANVVQLGGNFSGWLSGSTADYDDWYILDGTGSANNDFLGDIRVTNHVPTGAGNYAQWTPSAGSNYQNVDEEPPDGGTTKNTAGTASLIDSFPVTTLSGAASVHFVVVQVIADKSDAGTATLATFVRQGSTDYAGTAQGLSQGSYLALTQVYQTDPSGTAWTQTAFNAAEFGYKRVT